MMKRLTLQTPLGKSRISIGSGVLASFAAEFPEIKACDFVFIVADENPWSSWRDKVLNAFPNTPSLLVVPGGERIKTLEFVSSLYNKFIDAGLTRNSACVSFGGGSVSDAAGFAAATYMRGITHYVIPTTLLSMADAAVGGKTGINLDGGKNLVGAFHHPRGVLADVKTLASLSAKQLAEGAAEIIKCAFISGGEFLAFIENRADDLLAANPAAAEEAVYLSLKLKVSTVEQDERDAGARMMLNFGHTIGHGFEAALEYRGITHGEAVAAGMAAESHLAERMGLCGPDVPRRLEAAIKRYNLPMRFPKTDAAAVLGAMEKDKKAAGGAIRFALPIRIGEIRVVEQPDVELISEIIRASM
jgi:3-dehydroquinate synthase